MNDNKFLCNKKENQRKAKDIIKTIKKTNSKLSKNSAIKTIKIMFQPKKKKKSDDNTGHYLAKQKKYYDNNNTNILAKKEYYDNDDNQKKILKRQKKYYKDHSEYMISCQKAYYKNHMPYASIKKIIVNKKKNLLMKVIFCIVKKFLKNITNL